MESNVNSDAVGEATETPSVKEERKPLLCTLCNECFADEVLYDRHLEMHEVKEDKPPSDSASYKSTGRRKAARRKASVNRGKVFKCDFCDKAYYTKKDLTRHLVLHTGEWRFICDLCGGKFYDNSKLIKHRALHDKPCPVCDKPCSNSRHHRVRRDKPCSNSRHHRVRRDKGHVKVEKCHQCKICNKTFASEKPLERHISDHAKTHICEFCDRVFKTSIKLRKHLLTHAGEKPFKCNVCGKGFSRKANLKEHQANIHSAEKPYRCNMCGSEFALKHMLNRHILIHTRPYVCEICLKSFARKEHLESHYVSHPERPVVKSDEKVMRALPKQRDRTREYEKLRQKSVPMGLCEICGKTVFAYGHLTRHLATHSETRPYQCKICMRDYTRKEHLTAHQRKHTGVRPFKCDLCGKGFTTRSQFQEHTRSCCNQQSRKTPCEASVE